MCTCISINQQGMRAGWKEVTLHSLHFPPTQPINHPQSSTGTFPGPELQRKWAGDHRTLRGTPFLSSVFLTYTLADTSKHTHRIQPFIHPQLSKCNQQLDGLSNGTIAYGHISCWYKSDNMIQQSPQGQFKPLDISHPQGKKSDKSPQQPLKSLTAIILSWLNVGGWRQEGMVSNQRLPLCVFATRVKMHQMQTQTKNNTERNAVSHATITGQSFTFCPKTVEFQWLICLTSTTDSDSAHQVMWGTEELQ